MTLAAWILSLLPASWLPANHYPPWLSAWQEGLALAIVAASAACFSGASGIPRNWAVALLLAGTTVALQSAVGHIHFGGDAAMVALYLAAFGLAILLGYAEQPSRPCAPTSPVSTVDAFGAALVLASLWSAGLAWAQWFGATHLGLWMVDLDPKSRPYANFAQPNHLCSALFLGLVAAAWLRQRGRIGSPMFWVLAASMLQGMVMTGSRTAWLQLAAFAGVGLALRRRTGLRFTPLDAAGILSLYVVLTAVWGQLNVDPLLDKHRPLADQMQAGVRLPLWNAMFSALQQQPWAGFGWQQVATAQYAVALETPALQRHFEHAHNVALDLLLWSGVPVGLAILMLIGTWIWSRLRRCTEPVAAWLLILVIGLLAHGMVEYPLEYAYFLMPLGIAIGAIDRAHPAMNAFPTAGRSVRVLGVLVLAALSIFAYDYIRAEEGYRSLRLQTARIGDPTPEPVPDLLVLDQLESFQRFARTQAHPGMTTEQVAAMVQLVKRFPYPSAMFRLALAQGLTGDPVGSAKTLRRLCSIHPEARCVEAREAWPVLVERYPTLRDVSWPP